MCVWITRSRHSHSLPSPHRSPLVDDLISFNNMVVRKQSGGQTGMVGDDPEQASDGILFEVKRVIGGDQSMFLGDTVKSQSRMIHYGPENDAGTQMISA